jgi:hypothetical protein
MPGLNEYTKATERRSMLARSRGRGGGASACKASTRNLKNIKDKHADQTAKKTCDTLLYSRFAYAEPPCLETAQFQKCMHIQDVMCSVIERIV